MRYKYNDTIGLHNDNILIGFPPEHSTRMLFPYSKIIGRMPGYDRRRIYNMLCAVLHNKTSRVTDNLIEYVFKSIVLVY